VAKFRTPYDTLLRVRRIEEDKAKAALAEANMARRAAAEQLDARREEYVAAAAAASVTNGETAVGGFMLARHHAEAAAASVGIAATDVEKADETRLLAVEDARVARMRTQGLEKLVERAKEARMDEMLAADQRTAEESMAGRQGRRKRS